jgi:lipopolysaccharide/colanic/teichoic acid biosynthesis glycosyltransferase
MQVYRHLVDYYTLLNGSGIQQRKPPLSRIGLGQWWADSHLDKLPMRLNMLRVEMSLVGPYPLAMSETETLPELRTHRLQTLSGIPGSWQTFSRTDNNDILSVSCRDTKAFGPRSVSQSLKGLAKTVAQTFSSSHSSALFFSFNSASD